MKRRNVKTGRKVYADLTRAGIISKEQIAMARNRLKAEKGLNRYLSGLKSGNVKVRLRAAWTLGGLKDKRATWGLVGALKDRSAGVRWEAAWSLGEIGDKRAVPALMDRVVKDEHAFVIWKAAEALKKIRAASRKGRSR